MSHRTRKSLIINLQSPISNRVIVPTFECPTCKTTFTLAPKADAPIRPFCSERCKMVDLGRWLDGTYRVSDPASPEDLDQASEESE